MIAKSPPIPLISQIVTPRLLLPGQISLYDIRWGFSSIPFLSPRFSRAVTYMSFKSYCLLGVSLLGSVVHGAATTPSAPTVNTVNGTYYGVNIPSFKQDAFLGIPYAQPPVGDLRFRRPQTYTQSWHGQRNATVRSDSCPGYQPGTALTGGGLTDGLTMGEDCLTMDIVRPANAKITDELPSFVWLYGGGKPCERLQLSDK
jgi:hypothetical protein